MIEAVAWKVRYRLPLLIFISVMILIILTVLQDFIEATVKHFPFYISEALLFKTTWILFLPLLLLQSYSLKINFVNRGILKKISSVIFFAGIHVVLVPFLIWSISALFFDHSYRYWKTLEYILSEDLYKLLLGYCLLPIIVNKTPTASIPSATDTIQPKQEKTDKFVVYNGKAHIVITTDDIQYIAAATPYVAIHVGNKNYLDTGTLKSIETRLNDPRFIRIHKSTIVNMSHVRSYTSRSNGDYDLALTNGSTVRLSRNFAKDFKTAFTSGTQVTL